MGAASTAGAEEVVVGGAVGLVDGTGDCSFTLIGGWIRLVVVEDWEMVGHVGAG